MISEIIKFSDVSFSYHRCGKNALNGIDFSVFEGEFLAVMGENCAGKTTLCRLINGIIPHFCDGNLSGTITVDGVNTRESSVAKLAHKVAMVLDDPDAQLFTSSVGSEAAFGPENFLLPAEEIHQRVEFALNAVGLAGFEDRVPSTLSGGEKQRLSIAASIAMQGKILVLDEPLCRLDPQGAAEVMSALKNLREKHRITVIMAAHDSAMMAEFADRICILKNGRVAALDTAKNIFAGRDLPEENGIQPFPGGFKNKNLSFRMFSGISESRAQNIMSAFAIKNKNAVEIRNFCFTYPAGARFENINLSVADNDFTAIIGNNGCGKTTLLKSVTGLLRPCGGEIFIRGRNSTGLSVCEISKEAGFVMQNPDTQLFTDSVYKEVSFALKNMRIPKAETDKRVEEALKKTGIEDSGAFPHALDRADRKKLLIACVLAMGSKILIFDEIDWGLDYGGIVKIMNIARDLHSGGFTIVFVTHNMNLAAEYAHRIIKLERNGAVEITI